MTIDWEAIMKNPNKGLFIERKAVWAMWNVLMSTDFDKRDEYWQYALEVANELLNQ